MSEKKAGNLNHRININLCEGYIGGSGAMMRNKSNHHQAAAGVFSESTTPKAQHYAMVQHSQMTV
jgi:hypothetical protein